MRTFILALILSTATALEPTTRRRALAHVGLATLAPLDATAIPPIAIENRPPPEVTAPSSKRQLRVVEALNAKGFEFYGAYWCRYCDEQRQVLGSPAGGLLQQELRHLVRHLGSISAAHGAPADALLPPMHTQQRRSLDVLLRAEGELSRPRTASSVESRESVRHLRCVGHASEGRPRLSGKATAHGTLPA